MNLLFRHPPFSGAIDEKKTIYFYRLPRVAAASQPYAWAIICRSSGALEWKRIFSERVQLCATIGLKLIFKFVCIVPRFEGAFGMGYCAAHGGNRRRPVESRDAPDALRSGNGNYQGRRVREVWRQLGLNGRACPSRELTNAWAKMLPNELVGGVGQSFLRLRVILLLGGNSTGQQRGEQLQTTDLG
jgi:hypothetical protein